MPLYYEVPAELTTETYFICSVAGCSSCCFDAEFAENMGCAMHGFTWLRIVRQFENGHMVSEFKAQS